MSVNPKATWYHSNRYNAASTCEHCGGVVRHERWCITCDPIVQYAYGVVLDPEKLTLRDRLIRRRRKTRPERTQKLASTACHTF